MTPSEGESGEWLGIPNRYMLLYSYIWGIAKWDARTRGKKTSCIPSSNALYTPLYLYTVVQKNVLTSSCAFLAFFLSFFLSVFTSYTSLFFAVLLYPYNTCLSAFVVGIRYCVSFVLCTHNLIFFCFVIFVFSLLFCLSLVLSFALELRGDSGIRIAI